MASRWLPIVLALQIESAGGQASVAKYMVRRRDPPSQGWRTFLRNHADGIATMDMFVEPTISFRLLVGFLIKTRKRAGGNSLPVTSFVTGTRPMVRSLFAGSDR